jgi:phage terminase large subunit-like protein
VEISDLQNMSLQDLLDLKHALEKLERVEETSGTQKWWVPGTKFSIENYPKHKLFFDLGKKYRERVFMCGNRVGKSISGAAEVSWHLTGLYPDWWDGRRFNGPNNWWVAGKDKSTTRDVIQKEMFGRLGAPGTGMIPANCIHRTWSMQGVPNGIEVALVKHVSGGYSEVGIKSFDRGVESFMGTAMDGIWLDEECPEDVYGECLIRTMTTGGILITTFTPKKGLTPLLVTIGSASDMMGGERFVEMEDGVTKPSRVIVQASWDDVPHLDETAKKEILSGTPSYLRDAVMKGVPTIGEGMVYPVTRSDIECDAFEIPVHFKRWYGMDVGWNCTAAVFFAEDPDSGQVYITHEYKGERAEPLIHAQAIKNIAGDWMLGAIDPASRNSSQKDGERLMQIYRNYGLKVTPANNAVNSGTASVWEGFSTGKLKVFKHCHNLFREQMVYRVENQQIKKKDDHLMDALRYGYNTRQIAQKKPLGVVGAGGSYAQRMPF